MSHRLLSLIHPITTIVRNRSFKTLSALAIILFACTQQSSAQLTTHIRWTTGPCGEVCFRDYHSTDIDSSYCAITSYEWTFGDGDYASGAYGDTSGGAEFCYTYSVSGTYSISLILTDACDSSVTVDTTITVSVGSASGTVSLGAYEICHGDTTHAYTTLTGGTWYSDNTSVAYIDSIGRITTYHSGVADIKYVIYEPCTATYYYAIASLVVDTTPMTGKIYIPSSPCAGSTVLLSSTGDGGGDWSIADTAIATINDTGLVRGVSVGTTVVTYRDSNACGYGDTTAILHVTLPSSGVITGTTEVCAGSLATVHDTAHGGLYSSSDTLVAKVNAHDGEVTGVSGGTTTIFYILSASACGSATASTTLTVDSGVTAGSLSTSEDPCVGTLVSGVSTGPSGGYWFSSSSSVVSVDSFGDITGVGAGDAVIFYVVHNACGTATASVGITVGEPPVVGPVTLTSPDSVCPGATISLADSATLGSWISKTPGVATVSTDGVVLGVAGGTATIIYKETNGCGSDSNSAIVTILPLPSIDPITGQDTICLGNSTTLADGAAGGTWSSSDSAIATINSGGFVTGMSVGAVTITYLRTNGCGADSASVVLLVDTLVPPAITRTADTLSTGSYDSYQWLLAGVPITGATAAKYVLHANGDYSVVVSSYGCSDTSAVVKVSGLATATISRNEDIRVFPNPTSSTVFIESATPLKARLLTLEGVVLQTLDAAHTVDMTALPRGMYLLELYDMQGVKLKTVSVVKGE
jgi:trimeric autotransporter adhesin